MNAADVEAGTDLKFQWNVINDDSNEQFMMLNTDIELAYDIDVDNTGNGTQCVIGEVAEVGQGSITPRPGNVRSTPCTEADTKNLVASYAGVNSVFFISLVHICERILL